MKKVYKKKPKMVMTSKMGYESPVEFKLKKKLKKIKPKTRKFKDGEEVTHQSSRRATAKAMTEYMSERAGGDVRKILRKKK
jgi:hypothetical protein